MILEPQIIRNFIDTRVKDILNKWTLDNYQNSYFTDANMGEETTTLTTRFFRSCRDIDYPTIAYQTQVKIIERFISTKFKLAQFCHGITNSITFNNGDIREHVDPIYLNNTTTYHFNLITQKPIEGGITYINNTPYETNETDLIIYPVSEVEHRVNTVKGDIPRIAWMFGFSIFKNNQL